MKKKQLFKISLPRKLLSRFLLFAVVFSFGLMISLPASAFTDQEKQAQRKDGPWYIPCVIDNTGVEGQESSGKIPAEGLDVSASYYGGQYSDGGWHPNNGLQGGGTDDTGYGNVTDPKTGKDIELPGKTAFAELSTNYDAPTNQLDFAALGKLEPFTKLAITYKGKTIIAEKLDVGAGGPSAKGQPPRAIDLWWEAARLLDFRGEGVVNVKLVERSTPVTPLNGKAVDATDSKQASQVCCSEGESGQLYGKDNIEKAYNYFLSKGLKDFQAAGIVGNLMQESGVNPKSNQAGGPGRGIAQWSEGGRWEVLKDFAKGKDPEDLQVQLDFLWHEMTKVAPWKDSLPAVQGSKTIEEATQQFEDKFEKAGSPNMPARIANAKKVLKLFGQGSGQSDTSGSPTTSSGCAANGGTGRVNVDGYAFPVQPQRKSQNGHVANLSQLPCPGSSCHHDGTSAFDIGRKPGEDASTGAAEYAIHDGTIDNLHIYMGISGCYSFHIKASDGWDYYYTHTSKPTVKQGQKVKSGQQVAEIGRRDCTGNRSLPHLHIDRGCDHKPGGTVGCRDPHFVNGAAGGPPGMNDIFNKLPN